MGKVATTKMSSKGQVVIPEEIRQALGLAPGAQFVVVGQDDVVILKRISPPAMSRRAGMKGSDVAAAVREVFVDAKL